MKSPERNWIASRDFTRSIEVENAPCVKGRLRVTCESTWTYSQLSTCFDDNLLLRDMKSDNRQIYEQHISLKYPQANEVTAHCCSASYLIKRTIHVCLGPEYYHGHLFRSMTITKRNVSVALSGGFLTNRNDCELQQNCNTHRIINRLRFKHCSGEDKRSIYWRYRFTTLVNRITFLPQNLLQKRFGCLQSMAAVDCCVKERKGEGLKPTLVCVIRRTNLPYLSLLIDHCHHSLRHFCAKFIASGWGEKQSLSRVVIKLLGETSKLLQSHRTTLIHFVLNWFPSVR